jgi:ubiquinone/menaquinone biosynthesis C-methylase UbiE
VTPSFEQIRDQQKETWNTFSPGWKKWDAFTMDFLRPMGEGIIAALRLREADHVLDIAAGTGEPGLSIALRVPSGKVIGTDLAEGMLEIAAARARADNRLNYETRVADVCALPFPDASFDCVSCRMGFMFFPDMALAAREIARVLKPGGRFSTSVWGPPEGNAWVTTIMKPVHHHVSLPPPIPGAPGMFRCAPVGLIAGLLRDAGFEGITETEIKGQVTYESAYQYWTMMMEVAAPVVAALSGAGESERAAVKSDVFTALDRVGAPVSLNYNARIITGERNKRS